MGNFVLGFKIWILSSPKAFRSAISWSENPHHRQHFSGDIFRHRPHHQERKEEICNFSQNTGAKNPSTHLPQTFFSDDLNPTRRHVRACDPLSGAELLPVEARSAPSCTSKPLSVLFEPCFSIFLAFQPPRVFFQPPLASDGSSLPWPRPVCDLGRPLLHLQSLFSFVWVPTYQVLLPQLWSDLPLELS